MRERKCTVVFQHANKVECSHFPVERASRSCIVWIEMETSQAPHFAFNYEASQYAVKSQRPQTEAYNKYKTPRYKEKDGAKELRKHQRPQEVPGDCVSSKRDECRCASPNSGRLTSQLKIEFFSIKVSKEQHMKESCRGHFGSGTEMDRLAR
ncbi:hypothetical protein EVAR_26795_1 [Eumeta japonica]|uniref:Uncharacterized protein n=1 Tax=Eumeta variegata TaxID=151549 RepID=A0A4C1WG32_EUMVA|nr:hypothetical protein EVAR_26795_1 [Eumeta japonica]